MFIALDTLIAHGPLRHFIWRAFGVDPQESGSKKAQRLASQARGSAQMVAVLLPAAPMQQLTCASSQLYHLLMQLAAKLVGMLFLAWVIPPTFRCVLDPELMADRMYARTPQSQRTMVRDRC